MVLLRSYSDAVKIQPVKPSAKSAHKMASAAQIAYGTQSSSKRCVFLELPLEVRLQIYNLVFDDSGLRHDGQISYKVEMSPQDHSEHTVCRRSWSEDDPSFHIHSNTDDHSFDFSGLPFRLRIPLLETCRTIREEATTEMYKNVKMALKTMNCSMRTEKRGLERFSTWQILQGEAMASMLEIADFSVEFERGGWHKYARSRSCCYDCEKDIRFALRRFPVMLKFFCRRVRTLGLEMEFRTGWCVDNAIKRLEDTVLALGEESTVRSIWVEVSVRALEHSDWMGREEEWIRKWKEAANTMSMTFPRTRAREALWREIARSFPNVTLKPRRLCKALEILDSKKLLRKEKPKGMKMKRVIAYLVRRQGYVKAAWEPEWDLLTRWRDMVLEFHSKNPSKVMPDEILDMHSEQEEATASDELTAQRLSNNEHIISMDVGGDMEDDVAFAGAMSKLSRTSHSD